MNSYVGVSNIYMSPWMQIQPKWGMIDYVRQFLLTLQLLTRKPDIV